MKKLSPKNVFRELGFNEAQTINLTIRADLMIAIREHIRKKKLTQKQAATQLGIDQPQISRLMNGKIDQFTVDKLLILAAKAGVKFSFDIAA